MVAIQKCHPHFTCVWILSDYEDHGTFFQSSLKFVTNNRRVNVAKGAIRVFPEIGSNKRPINFIVMNSCSEQHQVLSLMSNNPFAGVCRGNPMCAAGRA